MDMRQQISQIIMQVYQEALAEGFGRNIQPKDLQVWLGRVETRIIKALEVIQNDKKNTSSTSINPQHS